MKNNARGVRNAILGIGLAGLLATACGDGGSSAQDDGDVSEDRGREQVDEGKATYGGNLVIGISGESDGWAPQGNTFADSGSFVIPSVIEALAVINDEGEPEPWLAESWEANDDFTQWTIKLRDGIEFHDGEPFDADAVEQNIMTAVQSPLVGIALGPMVKDVTPVDDLTVRIDLKRPWSSLPNSMLSQQPGMMVSPKMLERDHLGADHPIGTGPFVFQEWEQDNRFVAVRNDNYWRKADNGDELPYLDSIEYRVIVDSGARADALESGDVDMMYTTRAADILDFREDAEDGSITLIEDNQSEETFVQLNEAVPPFDNVHARRAAAMAIDSVSVAAALGEGIAEAIDQPFGEGHPAHNPDPGYVAFDIDAAKEEVERYKEDTGEENLAFAMKGLNSVDDAALIQLLEQQWRQAGIEVQLETVEQTTFITDLALGNFQAAFFRNFSYRQLDSLYVFLHSENANYGEDVSINFTNTEVDEIDELLEETRQTSTEDAELWNGNYREITRLLNEELPYIWLFRTPYALAASPEVKGLNTPREIGFGNFEPKVWVQELWLDR